MRHAMDLMNTPGPAEVKQMGRTTVRKERMLTNEVSDA